MFKVNNRNTRTNFAVFIVNFEHISQLCSNVSIVNFEQVNSGWVGPSLAASLEPLAHR